jgi:AraC-like DNA-binding protein
MNSRHSVCDSPEMTDPLAQIVDLMQPRAVFSKGITGAGAWSVRYAAFGHPGFCAVLQGRCRLAVDGGPPVELAEGDFVLLPATPSFVMSSLAPARPRDIDPLALPLPAGEVRHGRQEGPPDVRLFGGHFLLASPDAALLVSLLPAMIHIRDAPRLTVLVRLLGEEAAADGIGSALILSRLVEILLIEALRASPGRDATPGLLRGLACPRIAAALRLMHGDTARSLTVADLARGAGMSRSAFFDRFTRLVGLRPAEYLLAWRMAVAKSLLRDRDLALDEVAARVGYGSASTFSTAFSRHAGHPPGRFRRDAA